MIRSFSSHCTSFHAARVAGGRFKEVWRQGSFKLFYWSYRTWWLQYSRRDFNVKYEFCFLKRKAKPFKKDSKIRTFLNQKQFPTGLKRSIYVSTTSLIISLSDNVLLYGWRKDLNNYRKPLKRSSKRFVTTSRGKKGNSPQRHIRISTNLNELHATDKASRARHVKAMGVQRILL